MPLIKCFAVDVLTIDSFMLLGYLILFHYQQHHLKCQSLTQLYLLQGAHKLHILEINFPCFLLIVACVDHYRS